jgi:hypothetical protein
MSSAGKWKITHWKDGHPVWCQISYDGKEIRGIDHRDLRDLQYAVERAIKECRDELPENYKHEMD